MLDAELICTSCKSDKLSPNLGLTNKLRVCPVIVVINAIEDFKFGACGFSFVNPPGLNGSEYKVSPSTHTEPVYFNPAVSKSATFKSLT